MSTNYYFRDKEGYRKQEELNRIIKNKTNEIMELVNEIVTDEEKQRSIRWRIEDAAYIGYDMIHIGKRSRGWKPIFEKCEEFKSVRGMKKWYDENKSDYEIVDEYDVVLTWSELEDELINWDGEREDRGCDTYKDIDGYNWAEYEFS